RVQRQLHVRREIARVIVGEQGFATITRPFHGPAYAPCRPGDERELRIARIARAVVAADLARDDTDGGARNPERLHEVVLDALHAARAGVERVVLAVGLRHLQRRARLPRDPPPALA